MPTILPGYDELLDLLCRWEAAPVFPTTLDGGRAPDVVPFTDCDESQDWDDDCDGPRYTLTALGEEATGGPLTPCRSDLTRCCPECGGPLITDSLYCGGRGYQTFDVCNSGECPFMRRANS